MSRIVRGYTFHEPPLGEGSFGAVYKATKNYEDYAIKVMESDNLKEALSEVTSLFKLNHPNVLRISEVFNEDGYLFIVTDLCDGNLEDLSGNVSIEKFTKYFCGFIEGLVYIHSRNFIHR
jgi:serine/threonine protein kinase